MTMTDPIADLLTRIRNAISAKHPVTDIPASRIKVEIARILKEEGYIKNFKVIEDGRQGILKILLKYNPDGSPVISGIQRVSRPGCRVYKQVHEIQDVLGGLGICIISTSKGILTGERSKKESLGGEVLCNVW